ncbi:MAG: energy-coupled thiamine transporter ThiT [Oscillospiraceae bacterium]|jgi:thiamine transporter|nr:energy-coupled thiamine transporter ThiT [Oscillospiraceae bacterium]
MRNKSLQALVESAILLALSVVLSVYAIYEMPNGGTVSFFAMAPLVIIGLRWGPSWGSGAALAFGIAQLLFGLKNFSYVQGIWAYIGVASLDYIIAFAAYGLAPIIAKPFCKTRHIRHANGQYDGKGFTFELYSVPNKPLGYGLAALATGLLQYACSFLSGILLWSEWAPESTPVWLYSLTYNATYALPNAAMTVIGTVVAMALLNKAFPVEKGKPDYWAAKA